MGEMLQYVRDFSENLYILSLQQIWIAGFCKGTSMKTPVLQETWKVVL